MTSGYSSNIGTSEFLYIVYVLMKNKINKIRKISMNDNTDIRELHTLVGDVQEALNKMVESLDFNKEEAKEMASIYVNISNLLNKAVLERDDKLFQDIILSIEQLNLS